LKGSYRHGNEAKIARKSGTICSLYAWPNVRGEKCAGAGHSLYERGGLGRVPSDVAEIWIMKAGESVRGGKGGYIGKLKKIDYSGKKGTAATSLSNDRGKNRKVCGRKKAGL